MGHAIWSPFRKGQRTTKKKTVWQKLAEEKTKGKAPSKTIEIATNSYAAAAVVAVGAAAAKSSGSPPPPNLFGGDTSALSTPSPFSSTASAAHYPASTTPPSMSARTVSPPPCSATKDLSESQGSAAVSNANNAATSDTDKKSSCNPSSKILRPCTVCTSLCSETCAACLMVSYCCKPCQIIDWKRQHKFDCNELKQQREESERCAKLLREHEARLKLDAELANAKLKDSIDFITRLTPAEVVPMEGIQMAGTRRIGTVRFEARNVQEIRAGMEIRQLKVRPSSGIGAHGNTGRTRKCICSL